jgi:tetratricopeptide (TPR) repeat protein
MSDPAKAVFLSYASQDAGVVLRIAEALRASGVEVWFDKDELVGGDAWDAKIRGQIASCALFVPVISAATQARREGYFRREWKQAAERTRDMADGTPFLLPVVIDATRDTEALVPAEFKAVQWTRLPGGDAGALEKFCGRVGKLLGGAVADVGSVADRAPGPRSGLRPRPVERDGGVASPALASGQAGRRVPAAAWAGGALAIAAVVALGGYFLVKRPPEAAPVSAQNAGAGTRPPTAEKSVARDWPRSAELKRVIALIDGLEATMEDFRLAEEIATRALAQAPADPETVTVMARVHSAFVLRNFDFSAERNALAKKYGERALQLAPDEPDALLALAIFLTERGATAVRGAELARRATERVPDEPRYWRAYARAVESQNRRGVEGLALTEQNAVRFPRDVLTRYELSISYRNRDRWADFEREIDATLALAPLANAINWKARAALLRGDLAEMRQWLDRVPARARTEERTVISGIIYASLSGDYDYGLAALQGFAEPWFYDAFNYSGPTALPRAEMLARQGKPGQARVHYEAALAELKRRQAASPSDFTGRAAEIWTLLGLGRREEALALHRIALEGLRRPWRVTALASWWFDVIPRALLLGDRETALALIRDSTVDAEGRRVIKLRMNWDARMAPFRDDPEIVVLLADTKVGAPE